MNSVDVEHVRLTSAQVAELAAISYRQLNYWSQKGWLDPEDGHGQGHPAAWPLREAFVAARMGALVAVGVSPAFASRMARIGGAP